MKHVSFNGPINTGEISDENRLHGSPRSTKTYERSLTFVNLIEVPLSYPFLFATVLRTNDVTRSER